MTQKPQKNIASIIKQEIGWRIAMCVGLVLLSCLISSVYDVTRSMDSMQYRLHDLTEPLSDFVISQTIVNNPQAIAFQLRRFRQENPGVQLQWKKPGMQPCVKTGIALAWPFDWRYCYRMREIQGQAFGSMVLTGSFLTDRKVVSDLLTRLFIFLGFAGLLVLILMPLARRIPRKIFIKPIEEILRLLRHEEKQLQGKSVFSQEMLTLKEDILALMQSVELQSRKSALYSLSLQVAHDIRSPLTALNVVLKNITTLPEKQRELIHIATQRINDIANNLLREYRDQDQLPQSTQQAIRVEPIVALLDANISENRALLNEMGISVHFEVDQQSWFSFAKVNQIDFMCVLSNLFTNANEAMPDGGEITIRLQGGAESLILSIKDTGTGIAQHQLCRVFDKGVSFGKVQGSGLGLTQAKAAIESWGGAIAIDSSVNCGTTVTMRLPKIVPPNYYCTNISLQPESVVIVLDDDESIHQVWRERFSEFDVQLEHFYHADDLLSWCQHHTKLPLLLLCDYNLGETSPTGLMVIRRLEWVDRAILVTSHFADVDLIAQCQQIELKLLPKNLSAYVPIVDALSNTPECKRSNEVDLILIDDNEALSMSWEFSAAAANKTLATFHSVDAFQSQQLQFATTIPIYIDSDLQTQIKGEESAKSLFEQGFETIYLTTGHDPIQFAPMPWIKAIVGKEPPF